MQHSSLIKYYLLFAFFLWLLNPLSARHDTLAVCQGESVQLTVDPGFATYRWQPVLGLSNPTIHNPVAVPAVTTMYVVESIPAEGENLIVNGNLNAGNSDFTSEYVYSPGANPTQGVYGIFDDANQLSPNFFEHCRDHTTQTGLMMVVDGSPIPNQRVWCQTIAIEPDETYAFSTWLTSILQPNPAALRFSINGEQIGETFIAGTQNCQWRQFYETWESGAASEAEICIINQNTRPDGNDFALDDFAFFEIGAPRYDTFTVVVNEVPVTRIDTTFCEGQTIEYQGHLIPVSPSITLTYTSQLGCDSIVRYQAEIVDTVTIINRVDTLCPGETFLFSGQLIDRDTLLCETFSTAGGCDTTVCLQAVFLTEAALETTEIAPACHGANDGRIELNVRAGLPPFQYRWENGTTESERFDLPAGTYQITVTDAKGCTATSSVNLSEPSALSATVNTSSTRCNGLENGQITIDASGGIAPYQYSIDNGQNFFPESWFSGLISGDYPIIILDGQGCTFSITARVPLPVQLTLDVPLYSQIDLGEVIAISVSDNSPTPLTYEWIPAEGVACPTCAETELRPLRTTLYTVQATDAFGCRVEAKWQIEVIKKEAVYLPNAFSPNGDGINEYFRLYTGPEVDRILEFSIYDRWGNRLFYRENCNSDCSWDGTRNGRVLDRGIYVFTARLRYLDGEIVPLSGEINLLGSSK